MPARVPASRSARLDVFPAFHKVAGRRVVVVGGGGEAAAKVRLLAETNAVVEVVAPHIDAELAAAVEAAGAVHVAEAFRPAHLTGAALVFSAREDEALDRAVVDAARIFGVPANAVDKPDLCDFYTGALVNRAPIAVAVTSTGAGPVLARHIRARIEALLPRSTGDLARLAESFRDAAARLLPDAAARRRFWARFFSGPVADTLHAGRADLARAEAQRLLNSAVDGTGFVWLVGAGPGAEDLLTLRAQRLLQEADVIVHDALVPQAVVAMGRRDARRIAVGKRKGAHSVAQADIDALLVALARDGHRVVRLKAGDPLVFGRAGEEMAALRKAGICFEVVPGVTAALAAAASAGIPLTLRGVASTLVFATGHDADGATLPGWAGLALAGATVAVYMGRTVAGAVSRRLVEAGLAASTPVAVVENAARPDERLFVGTLDALAALADRPDVTGPVLIVVGDAVAHASLQGAAPIAVRPIRQSVAA
ncbi:siroheme synthase CysG [Polymorphum gilvum]|uniref:Uroporphyrin-III C-methyltransferase domain protein n=1 Tax=Polymorphum gilvum (strain LMG 25793 / CGMCC 1.9160 / SL003B-26A1) TaxID=991905 RepID=F2J110_POLGS|nr:siroheme synthase CysG [Polymorphum gilvum]ADZ71956.1 Uroporphyrin-III C-methyltransferase domain protein [Polymorphum gilvum SL003B-26A1]